MFRMFRKKVIWKDVNKILPLEGQKVIIKCKDDTLHSSIYQEGKFTLYEFIGMPFYDVADVQIWCNYKEFLSVI